MVKNPPTSPGDARDAGLIPGLGRSAGVGNGDPLQYSCLENYMHKGAWKTTVHEVKKSQLQLSMHRHTLTHTHTHTHISIPPYTPEHTHTHVYTTLYTRNLCEM